MFAKATLAPVAAAFLAAQPVSAQCDYDWQQGFARLEISDTVYATGVFDRGSGPELYIGGSFGAAGGMSAQRLARWDGNRFHSLAGFAQNTQVRALLTYDDGSGESLFVAGNFPPVGGTGSKSIARWDGDDWFPLDSGIETPSGTAGHVRALAVFDDGNGVALYAAGTFATAGGTAAQNIARWDGSSWSALGTGLEGSVNALLVHDDGSGPALYAAGFIPVAGGVPTSNVVRWDGTSWSDVGGGTAGAPAALAEYDDGTGMKLYAGGGFSQAGGTSAENVAAWDGSSWSAVGTGLDSTVWALHVADAGSGPVLYAGGGFTSAGALTARRVAQWDGSLWREVGGGADSTVFDISTFDDGNSEVLVLAGHFEEANGELASRVAVREGIGFWEPLIAGVGLDEPVQSMRLWDDGTGEALYVGGSFTMAGDVPANGIAKWDGAWAPLGNGVTDPFVNGVVHVMTPWDDGNGEALYVGGAFTDAGGVAVEGFAKWDGATWSAVGGPFFDLDSPIIYAIQPWDDGTGEALYVGGRFSWADQTPANKIAKWDGREWTALSGGLSGTSANGGVKAIVPWDDGTGPSIFVGGQFQLADGLPNTWGHARWDGTSWSPIGGGQTTTNIHVRDMLLWDDGTGEALYYTGLFTNIGAINTSGIARWDGTTWSGLDSGLFMGMAMHVFDDGTGGGEALYVGGAFSTAGPENVQNVARWDGSEWSNLRSGVNNQVNALQAFDDGEGFGTSLFVGGSFGVASSEVSSRIARWARDCAVQSYCTAAPNSVGDGALLDFSGGTSLAANDFTLEVDEAPDLQFGTFYYGPAATEVPFGDGFRCVDGGALGTFRLNPPDQVGANGRAERLVDFSQPPASSGSGAIVAGSTWYFQFWYRDPFGPGGSGFNLTNGLSASFVP